MCQLPRRALYSFFSHKYTSFLFPLLILHQVFHLIVHPHNFLIRFAERTAEKGREAKRERDRERVYSAARALCCVFFCRMQTSRSLLHYSATRFLSLTFCIAVNVVIFILIQLRIHHRKNDQ